jgi:hypothetical protein
MNAEDKFGIEGNGHGCSIGDSFGDCGYGYGLEDGCGLEGGYGSGESGCSGFSTKYGCGFGHNLDEYSSGTGYGDGCGDGNQGEDDIDRYLD